MCEIPNTIREREREGNWQDERDKDGHNCNKLSTWLLTHNSPHIATQSDRVLVNACNTLHMHLYTVHNNTTFFVSIVSSSAHFIPTSAITSTWIVHTPIPRSSSCIKSSTLSIKLQKIQIQTQGRQDKLFGRKLYSTSNSEITLDFPARIGDPCRLCNLAPQVQVFSSLL